MASLHKHDRVLVMTNNYEQFQLILYPLHGVMSSLLGNCSDKNCGPTGVKITSGTILFNYAVQSCIMFTLVDVKLLLHGLNHVHF